MEPQRLFHLKEVTMDAREAWIASVFDGAQKKTNRVRDPGIQRFLISWPPPVVADGHAQIPHE